MLAAVRGWDGLKKCRGMVGLLRSQSSINDVSGVALAALSLDDVLTSFVPNCEKMRSIILAVRMISR